MRGRWRHFNVGERQILDAVRPVSARQPVPTIPAVERPQSSDNFGSRSASADPNRAITGSGPVSHSILVPPTMVL
jgi:hypothetical protein